MIVFQYITSITRFVFIEYVRFEIIYMLPLQCVIVEWERISISIKKLFQAMVNCIAIVTNKASRKGKSSIIGIVNYRLRASMTKQTTLNLNVSSLLLIRFTFITMRY